MFDWFTEVWYRYSSIRGQDCAKENINVVVSFFLYVLSNVTKAFPREWATAFSNTGIVHFSTGEKQRILDLSDDRICSQ